MRIISLTSIPPRFDGLAPTLTSLSQQGADEVRLYIPYHYNRFPEWDGTLPSVPDGVSIYRCDHDYGPATKILPACHDLRGTDAQILFCDDDCICSPGWAERLFTIQSKRKNEAVAVYVRPAEGYVSNQVEHANGIQAWQLPIKYAILYRFSRVLHKIFRMKPFKRRPFVIPGYGDIFFGVAGVVVKPEFFDDMAFDIPAEAWGVDDVWLSGNLARQNINIYCPWMAALPSATEMSNTDALLDTEFQGMSRQELNRSAAQYCQNQFGIWT